ncbi:MAG: hypothetical protein ACK5KT_04500 [Dysgonomonas sp.]
MKVALFMKEEKIEGTYTNTIPIIVLHIDSNSITNVEKDFLIEKDINYLALWLLVNRIRQIYVMDMDTLIKKLFERLGIIVSNYKDMERNPLLRAFMY